jgi:hypothetical protein
MHIQARSAPFGMVVRIVGNQQRACILIAQHLQQDPLSNAVLHAAATHQIPDDDASPLAAPSRYLDYTVKSRNTFDSDAKSGLTLWSNSSRKRIGDLDLHAKILIAWPRRAASRRAVLSRPLSGKQGSAGA